MCVHMIQKIISSSSAGEEYASAKLFLVLPENMKSLGPRLSVPNWQTTFLFSCVNILRTYNIFHFIL